MIHTLEHIVLHALKDNLSILPFLFLTYCAMEYMEHFVTEHSEGRLQHSGRMGPLWGGLLGVLPQCGFSAAAASLYSGGVITLGTLLAVFLSTSDEMLPILISAAVPAGTIVRILGAKVLIAVVSGFLIDLVSRPDGKHIHDFCRQDNCHCEHHSVWRSALVHTVKVFVFIFAVTAALNLVLELGGERALVQFAAGNSGLAVVLAGLVGLVPNCAASVIITQLYLKGLIGPGAMMAGLLVGAGVGVLVLFRTNRPMGQNVRITALLYAIGIAAGFAMELLGITF